MSAILTDILESFLIAVLFCAVYWVFIFLIETIITIKRP